MSSFAPVEAAPAPAPPRDQHRTPVHYGAALSHRDAVQEKLRVDPVALANKKRPHAEVRANDPPREGYDADERERAGQYVDVDA